MNTKDLIKSTYKLAFLRLEVELARSEGRTIIYVKKDKFTLSELEELDNVIVSSYARNAVEYWRIKILNPDKNLLFPGVSRHGFIVTEIRDEDITNATQHEVDELEEAWKKLTEARAFYEKSMKRDEEERREEKAAAQKWERGMRELLGMSI